MPLFDAADQPWQRLGDLATGLLSLEEISDDTIEGIRRKQERYEELVRSSGYLYGSLWADAWCAAFVWKKTKEFPYPITEEAFRRIERNPFSVAPWMRNEIQRLAQQYQFFHWHLAFPDVFRLPTNNEKPENEQAGWSDGFDVVLGNPPWDRVKLQEKEWFATRKPDIVNATNAVTRRHLIEALKTEDPALYKAFLEDRRQAEGESHFVRNSGRYPLCGRGNVNTYAVFAETNRTILDPTGHVGCIVPSGIATDDTTKLFFADLMESRVLVSLYDFENAVGLFPGIGHGRFKFCLLTLSGIERPSKKGTDFVFFARLTDDLREHERHFTLTAQDLALLNPNTRTCPAFRNKHDAELTKAIYNHVPVLIKEGPPEENPWGMQFLRMLDMTNDSKLFRSGEQLKVEGWRLESNIFENGKETYLPLYEAKMFHHFDHRFGDYADYPEGALTSHLPDIPTVRLQNPHYCIQPCYWVPRAEIEERLRGKWDREWLIGWRDITNATNERTVIASKLPWVVVGNNAPIMLSAAHSSLGGLLIANMSSFVFDFVSRFKIGGTHLNFFILNQLPVLPLMTYDQPCPWHTSPSTYSLHHWSLPRVLELTYTAWDLHPFAMDSGYDGPPFHWDDERRFLLRCEIDAAYFHLYSIARGDVDYIIETFPIVKRKDEQNYGEYRTKRVILEIYDAMADAMCTGKPYRTLLDPPPADPRVAHPPRQAAAG